VSRILLFAIALAGTGCCSVDPCRCGPPQLTLKGPSVMAPGDTTILYVQMEPAPKGRVRYRFRSDAGHLYPNGENDFASREYRAPETQGKVTIYAVCLWCPKAKPVSAELMIEVRPREPKVWH